VSAALAVVVVVALGAAVRAVIASAAVPAAQSPFEHTAAGTEPAPLRVPALAHIERLLRELPDEDAEDELRRFTGGPGALERALR